MTIKQRRFFYLSLIIIFLIISPLFIGYSLGYRYNFQQQKLQKTGALYLRSYPPGAEIILNNKNTRIKTPNKIRSLLPGEYQIKLQKNDYFPWQKDLEIHSSLTTFAEDVYLFKNPLPAVILNAGEVINFLTSPTRKKIIYTIRENKIFKDYLFYFNSFKSDLIGEAADQKTFISWSPDEEKILFKDKTNHYLIIDTTNQNNLINLWQIINLSFNYLIWDEQNSNLLWGLSNQQLYKIDLLTKQTEKIFSPEILSLLSTSDGIYFIFQKPPSPNLTIALAKFKKFEETKEIGELPYAKNYQLKEMNNWLFIYNPEIKSLYFMKFNEQNALLYNVLQSVNGYSLKDNQLLYWNDFEYWIYNLENQNNQLVERLSQPILNVFWHPKASYLLVEMVNLLKIIEIDERDQKNSYELIKPEQPILDKITFNPSNDTLVFASLLNKQNGLFSLLIQ